MPVLMEEATSASLRESPLDLVAIARHFMQTTGWVDRTRFSSEERWYERVHLNPDYDVWLISWLPGQSTGFHDHGESAGAFAVLTGVLEEHRQGEPPLVMFPGDARAFGGEYAHDVRNESPGPAVSLHVYSPPLREMNEFEMDGGSLVPRKRSTTRAEELKQDWRDPAAHPAQQSAIDTMLARARSRLLRLSPAEAQEAAANGAVLIDIRPEAQRATEGSIPGALVIERNVLEWRLDPESSARLPVATGKHLHVIVFCSEGYTSSLAAAALQDLGLWRATDIAGGFKAWLEQKLPTVP